MRSLLRPARTRPAIRWLVPSVVAGLSVAATSPRGLRHVFIVSRMESEIRAAANRGWYPPQPRGSALPSPASRAPGKLRLLAAHQAASAHWSPGIPSPAPKFESFSRERVGEKPTALAGCAPGVVPEAPPTPSVPFEFENENNSALLPGWAGGATFAGEGTRKEVGDCSHTRWGEERSQAVWAPSDGARDIPEVTLRNWVAEQWRRLGHRVRFCGGLSRCTRVKV